MLAELILVGAMSYGFIKTMRENPNQSYVEVGAHFTPYLLPLIIFEVLQNTRQLLAQHYQQIPQLSVGGEYDLRQKVSVSVL
jgi:hypothetical protein